MSAKLSPVNPDHTGSADTGDMAVKYHAKMIAAAIASLPPDVGTAKEIRRLRGSSCEESLTRAMRLLVGVGRKVFQRLGKPDHPDFWLFISLRAYIEMQKALLDAVRLDILRLKSGQPVYYQKFAVFDTKEGIAAVLQMTLIECRQEVKILRTAKCAPAGDIAAADGQAELDYFRSELLQLCFGGNHRDESSIRASAKPPERTRHAHAELMLATLRESIRDGGTLEDEFAKMRETIADRASDMPFLRKLVETLNEIISQERAAVQGPPVKPAIPIPAFLRRFYLPLCLWECHKIGKMAYERCSEAATLLNFKFPDWTDFEKPWNRAKQRDFKLSVSRTRNVIIPPGAK